MGVLKVLPLFDNARRKGCQATVGCYASNLSFESIETGVGEGEGEGGETKYSKATPTPALFVSAANRLEFNAFFLLSLM